MSSRSMHNFWNKKGIDNICFVRIKLFYFMKNMIYKNILNVNCLDLNEHFFANYMKTTDKYVSHM